MGYKFNPLSGQFDLVNPPTDLSGYVPYTGASNNVQLGSYGLSAQQLSATSVNALNLGVEDPTILGYGAIALDNGVYSFLDSLGSQANVRLNDVLMYDPEFSDYGRIELEFSRYTFRDYLSDLASIQLANCFFYDAPNAGYASLSVNDNNLSVIGVSGAYCDLIAKIYNFEDTLNAGNFGTIYYEDGGFIIGDGTTNVYAGGISISNTFSVSTLGGLLLATDYANNRFGIGISSPQARVHQHIAGATANAYKITNGTTGQTSADGFDIGITTTGVAEIRQRENQQLDIFVNNTNIARYETSGKCLVRQGAAALRGAVATVVNRVDTVGNVGVGEDDLYSFSSPSSTFNQNGDCLQIEYAGSFAANANNKRIRMYFGAQVIFDTTALAFNAGTWRIKASVYRVTTTTLRAIVDWTSSNATLAFKQTYTAWAGNVLTTNIIKITGEATANNDVTAETSNIKWIPIS